MKYLQLRFTALLLILLSISLTGQIKNPVKFSYDVKELSDGMYEAVLTAKMEKGWHIYSKDIPEDSGIPTAMKLSGKNIQPVGKMQEAGKKISEFSEAFGAQIVYYSGSAKFIQKFKLKDPSKPAEAVAEITYQTCDDRVCLAPNTLEFEKSVAATSPAGKEEETEKASENKATDSTGAVIPEESVSTQTAITAPAVASSTSEGMRISSLNHNAPLTDCGTKKEKISENFWTYLFLGFIGGFIALLTPCVYPMIPLTVSYFTKSTIDKDKGKREALLYGLFILLIFALISVPFHIIDGIAGNIFNEISTNVWLNIAFFLIFIYFAGSFFGFYDISLPSGLANKSSQAESAGGLIGIFFMALTLVIVSFSCTGPILGSLLGSAITGSQNVPMLLTMALTGFGLSWAIVFGLLALFPQTLKNMPKSGGWMNTVKVVLGFIELALAFKFLSKADLVSKMFLLKREIFIGLWILISIGLVCYLFGLIFFPHDNKKAKISPFRKVLGVLGILWIVYLVQGLIPSDRPKLQALSGILPPLNVSLFHNEKDGILGMTPSHDYYEAIEIAKKENKPVLIDFTGYGCENCRKMEEFVWSQDDVLPLLQNDVVLASLYVDDKEELPEAEQTKIDLGGGQKKKIKTIGDKWSSFQQVNFNNNSQPHYVLITPDEKVINYPVSGYMDKDVFKAFLQCGIQYYNAQKK